MDEIGLDLAKLSSDGKYASGVNRAEPAPLPYRLAQAVAERCYLRRRKSVLETCSIASCNQFAIDLQPTRWWVSHRGSLSASVHYFHRQLRAPTIWRLQCRASRCSDDHRSPART